VLGPWPQQESPKRDLLEQLQHRQNVAELGKRLRGMHAADLAFVLDALNPDDRTTVWEQVAPEQAGDVFVEASDSVRRFLVEITPPDVLVSRLSGLDAEDLAYVSVSLPPEIREQVAVALESSERSFFEESIQYGEQSVGHYMTREWVEINERRSVGDALIELRQRGSLPAQTDRLFVVDARHVLCGTIPLPVLLVQDPTPTVAGLIEEDIVSFKPVDEASDAAAVFQRYDLISAPVLTSRQAGRPVDGGRGDGRCATNRARRRCAARDSTATRICSRRLDSARNRWPWLAINLVTAFIAPRVIGQFEGVIQQLPRWRR
jgi:magnesium transporter